MVYFPREVLTASAVFARIVDLIAGVIILVVTMIIVGQPMTIHALWLFPFLLIQILFTLGVVFPLAALNLYFHDVRFLVGVALNLWFFLTPIMYPQELVPSKYAFVYNLNPMSRLINSYRWALFKDVSPPLDSFFFALLISIVAILLGYIMFKKMEHGFADNI
jgi:lipopolysaccharide transport system permease protein